MNDPTPTELADDLARWRKHGAVILERETLRAYADTFATALEAQIAETARLQAAIDKVREGVSARLNKDWEETQLIGTPVWNALDWIDHELADDREKSARSAGSSSALEAVKADTTTEWGHSHFGEVYPDFDENAARSAASRGFLTSLVSRQVTEWVRVETEGESRG